MTLSTNVDKKKVKDALFEISASMTRIEGERDFIKEMVNNISEDYEIPKRTIKALAKVYHKQNYSEEVANHEEFQEFYELIVDGQSQ